MIWKTIHLREEAKQGGQLIHDRIAQQVLPLQGDGDCFRIAVVGAGPKGMYAIDQLFYQLNEASIPTPMIVSWFNSNEDFGCGPNYNVHQPDYLLINYCIGHIDTWMRKGAEDTDGRLTLLEWIRHFCQGGDKAQPTDFASRALVGYYLQCCALQIIRSAPTYVQLFLLAEKVNNIEQLPDHRLLIHAGTRQWKTDNILLATGHCYSNKPLIPSYTPLPSSYFRRAYPVSHLDGIPSPSRVGTAGLGLTFIDVALHLTEGRGGTFDHEGTYMPSGREPTIFPFSRNHLPILPRGPIYGDDTYQLHYIDDAWIERMSATHQERKIDFYADIYPMLEKEIRFAYYSTLLQTRQDSEVEYYIDSLKEEQIFGVDELLFPRIEKKETIQRTYIDYIEKLIHEAEQGELRSPLMAAAAVWREATAIIGKWYKACGFTGESQHKLDKELFGAFCRTSFGPPIANMKKIRSLLQSGIIQITFDDPVDTFYDDNSNCFILRSKKESVAVDYLIDARIARPNLENNNAHLYHMLLQNKLISPLENDGYRPGCPLMDEQGRSVVDGHAIPLYFYGSNTEGFLLDNDSLSRTKNNLTSSWISNITKQLLTHKQTII